MEEMYLKKYCPIIMLVSALLSGGCFALQDSVGSNGTNAKVLHLPSYGITGDGVKIGFISVGNVWIDHRAFWEGEFCHVDNNDTTTNYNFHETPFAGIILSRGDANHPNDIGVAPDSFVHCVRMASYSPSSFENALNILVSKNCQVIVTGLAFRYDPNQPEAYELYKPDGNSDFTKIYDYYAKAYNLVFANAAGNYVRDENGKILFRQITIFGDAYNGITTGALAELPVNNYCITGSASSEGYTMDGRRKPDVIAPSTNQVTPGYNRYWEPGWGDGATSWSVPHTAGTAALLLQYANGSAEPNDDKNTVIKAVIVNSAFPNIRNKAGFYTDPANRVWDPNRGYGRIDALKAYQTLSEPRITKGISTIAIKGWAYDTLNNNQKHSYFIWANKNERLLLTATWNRQITFKGSYNEVMPRFNIDVKVKNPEGATDYNDTDTINNLIKIDLPVQNTGEYEIVLTNIAAQNGSYALAFERLEPLTCDFNSDFIIDNKDLCRMAFDWLSAESGLETNLIADANVNNLDYGVFAENWMRKESRYYHP